MVRPQLQDCSRLCEHQQGRCHVTCTRHSRRFSRPQWLDPRPLLQACCILLPIMGFTRFRLLRLGRSLLRHSDQLQTFKVQGSSTSLACETLQSVSPTHSLPPCCADTSAQPPFTPSLTAPLALRSSRSARCVHGLAFPLAVCWLPSATLGSLSPFGSESNFTSNNTVRPQGFPPSADPLPPANVSASEPPDALLGFGCSTQGSHEVSTGTLHEEEHHRSPALPLSRAGFVTSKSALRDSSASR